MSIDELAAQAKDGDEETLLSLWAQVKRFGIWIGRKYDIDADDKQQTAFEAFIRAVRSFDANKGSFLRIYKYALHSAFTAAKYGGRSERNINDPLHAALSLDAPASEDTDTPLRDLIADKIASDEAAAFEVIEQREREQAVRDAIAQLTEREQAVIFCIFFEGMSRDAAAAALRISAAEVKKTEAEALRHLRNPRLSKNLRTYL
jgi:RNA polymerase sigma factor (sigma-70 family)